MTWSCEAKDCINIFIENTGRGILFVNIKELKIDAFAEIQAD